MKESYLVASDYRESGQLVPVKVLLIVNLSDQTNERVLLGRYKTI